MNKEKNQEVVPMNNTPAEFNAEILISKAIDKDVSVETMERLLAMRKELRAEYAQSEYNKAMAEFQAECPIIRKRKKVNFGKTNYSYAPLDDIISQVKQFLQKNGFSYSVNTEVDKNMMTAICKSTHKAGHSEESRFQIPTISNAGMNEQQKYASALTYAKRYAFCNAFGILTGDDDNDMANTKKRTPTVEPTINHLNSLLVRLATEAKITITNGNVNMEQILAMVKVYNEYTGADIKSLKITQDTAKKYLFNFLNSPLMMKKS